jgi:inner membrane protease ATP23
MRGHFAFAKQFQVCVKRRAILSLKENPKFAGPGIAKEAVNRVWDRCFNDKAPFDDIY